MTWREIRQSEEFQGRWVALDSCRYDARTAQPVEGTLVDVDDDLVELCRRLQESNNRHCAILFCDEQNDLTPSSPAVSSKGTTARSLPH